MMIPDTIRWGFIYVFHLIGILMLSGMLIEILLVVNMVAVIVLAVRYIGPVVPCWNVSLSWEVNSIKYMRVKTMVIIED